MAGKFKSLPPIERIITEQGSVAVWCKALSKEEVEISEDLKRRNGETSVGRNDFEREKMAKRKNAGTFWVCAS